MEFPLEETGINMSNLKLLDTLLTQIQQRSFSLFFLHSLFLENVFCLFSLLLVGCCFFPFSLIVSIKFFSCSPKVMGISYRMLQVSADNAVASPDGNTYSSFASGSVPTGAMTFRKCDGSTFD